MRYAKVLVVLTASVSAIASCALLPSFEFDGTGGPGGAMGSSASSSTTSTSVSTSVSTGAPSTSVSTSSTGGIDQCGITFPSYPSFADASGTISFTAAIHSINLGDESVVGLDLDQTCSCHGKGASCIEPSQHCDDEAGRDNGASAIFNTLKLAVGSSFSSAGLTAQTEAGNWSILYRVKGYNGKSNDAQVELDWYLPTGFDKTTVSKPQWDGSDKWNIVASSLNNSKLDEPLYQDKHAYVSNDILVASIPETPIPLPIGNFARLSFTLTGAGIIARVWYDKEFNTYRLIDGQMVGRLKLTNLFKTLSSYRDNKGNPLCTNNAFYGIVKNNFCSSADILTVLGTPSLPCDAISFAVGFTADPAELGAVDATVTPTPPGCPAATDPATDKCDP